MRAPTLPVPTELQPPPPDGTDGDGDGRRRPAPFGAIVAALARMTSHAGEPSSLTVTRPGHAVAITVEHHEHYGAWLDMLAVAGVAAHEPREQSREAHAVLHGWALTIRLIDCYS